MSLVELFKSLLKLLFCCVDWHHIFSKKNASLLLAQERWCMYATPSYYRLFICFCSDLFFLCDLCCIPVWE
ncbi:hypothetical protein LDENG_00261240 [Lucifuga dentata]|nr:hypothetical protein LDENG_00261240 [Lucifuga dentata]